MLRQNKLEYLSDTIIFQACLIFVGKDLHCVFDGKFLTHLFQVNGTTNSSSLSYMIANKVVFQKIKAALGFQVSGSLNLFSSSLRT
jgi:hypothetical protein